jgi:hypothetical protein
MGLIKNIFDPTLYFRLFILSSFVSLIANITGHLGISSSIHIISFILLIPGILIYLKKLPNEQN